MTDKIIFNIETSEGEKYSKTLNLPQDCGSSFFYFPKNPYEENPEFENNLVLGSGGTAPCQIIVRAEPQGHKNSSVAHINICEGYIEEKKNKKS